MAEEAKPSESSTDEEIEKEVDETLTGDEVDEENKPENKKGFQHRIDQLTAEKKELEDRLEEVESKVNKPTETPAETTPPAPDDLKAAEYLKKLGFTTKSEIEDKVRAIEDRIALDTEHNRLGSTYDGSDGRPSYDKKKVEAYMRDHAVYDPEIAYKSLHEAELLDWHSKKTESGVKKKPFVEKPGGGGGRQDNNSITREKLQDVAANPTPVNRAWYEQNRQKILQMMAEGQL